MFWVSLTAFAILYSLGTITSIARLGCIEKDIIF